MTTIWAFLSDPTNRDVLSWIGVGLVVVCGGLWTVITFFRKPAAAPGGEGGARITTYGLSGWPLVMLVGVFAGALVLVAAMSGGARVTASNGGVGIGGSVSGSTITTGQ
jgi:hypothetical protein